MKIKVDLGDVQRTLFMPVWARAVETRKSKPMLTDETAVKIIEDVDFDFSYMSQNVPEISQIAWIARCKRFDLVVSDFIKRHPKGIVINIGCGLDTSYERINDHSIRWYDLDNILFIAAGVFVYFEESEIKEFILKVADRFNRSEMFFDVTSPKGVEIANQVILKSGLDSKSFFKWGLTDKSVIQSWDNRIHLIATYYTYQIDGLDLSPQNEKIAKISDSLDIQYMIHLKIQQS